MKQPIPHSVSRQPAWGAPGKYLSAVMLVGRRFMAHRSVVGSLLLAAVVAWAGTHWLRSFGAMAIAAIWTLSMWLLIAVAAAAAFLLMMWLWGSTADRSEWSARRQANHFGVTYLVLFFGCSLGLVAVCVVVVAVVHSVLMPSDLRLAVSFALLLIAGVISLGLLATAPAYLFALAWVQTPSNVHGWVDELTDAFWPARRLDSIVNASGAVGAQAPLSDLVRGLDREKQGFGSARLRYQNASLVRVLKLEQARRSQGLVRLAILAAALALLLFMLGFPGAREFKRLADSEFFNGSLAEQPGAALAQTASEQQEKAASNRPDDADEAERDKAREGVSDTSVSRVAARDSSNGSPGAAGNSATNGSGGTTSNSGASSTGTGGSAGDATSGSSAGNTATNGSGGAGSGSGPSSAAASGSAGNAATKGSGGAASSSVVNNAPAGRSAGGATAGGSLGNTATKGSGGATSGGGANSTAAGGGAGGATAGGSPGNTATKGSGGAKSGGGAGNAATSGSGGAASGSGASSTASGSNASTAAGGDSVSAGGAANPGASGSASRGTNGTTAGGAGPGRGTGAAPTVSQAPNSVSSSTAAGAQPMFVPAGPQSPHPSTSTPSALTKITQLPDGGLLISLPAAENPAGREAMATPVPSHSAVSEPSTPPPKSDSFEKAAPRQWLPPWIVDLEERDANE